MSMKSYFNKENLIALIKFIKPEFYNKVTWTIVLSGLSIASSSLWENLFSYILERELEFSISSNDDGLIGFGLVVIALIYNCAIRWIELAVRVKSKEKADDKNYAHDVNKFNYFNEVMPEASFENFLSTLENDHAFFTGESGFINDFCQETRREENKFNIPELEEKKAKLRMVLNNLSSFLMTNFFFFPNNQSTRLCLYPDYNIDRGCKSINKEDLIFYNEKLQEMHKIIDDSRTAFKDYRGEVKRTLYV